MDQVATRLLDAANQRPAGHIHLAKTSDIDSDSRRVALLRRVRYGPADFYVLGWVGTVWVEAGMNRAGLVIGANSGPGQPSQHGDGVPQHFGLYPLLYKASTVPQALDELARFNFAGKGLIFGLADAEGNAAVVEKTGTAQDIRVLETDAIIGVNDFLTPHMQAFNHARAPSLIENCNARRERFAQWAHSTDVLDANSLKALLADTNGPGAICQTDKTA